MAYIENTAKVNGVNIAYQLHGDENLPTLLLLHGLSTPLTGWPTQMVKSFVAQGFRVLLVDNRDIGQSQLCEHLKIPNLLWFVLKQKLGISTQPPYQLEDMKNDVVSLLEYLNISKVHVIGASMGGMIAQLLAIHHPRLAVSLTSIMSTTGDKSLPKMDKAVSEELAKKPKSKRYEDRLEYHANKWKLLGSEYYQAEPEVLHKYVDSMLERGITAQGTTRQILAILAAKDRTPMLNRLVVPALVLHGDADRLVKVECGKATAQAIPNSQLKIYSKMGHDFPAPLIPEIVQDIVQFIQQSDNECSNDTI